MRKKAVRVLGVGNVVVPAPRDIWERLEQNDREGLPNQSWAWINAERAAGNEDASRFYEFAGGQQIVVPLARTKLPWIGFQSLATMRGMGFLARHQVEPEILRMILCDILAEHPFRTYLRPNPRHASLWAAAVPKAYASHPRKAHILDLSGGFPTVWSSRFDSNTRRHIRKAERCGIEVKCDRTGELIPIFYDLYLRSVQRWAEQDGKPVRAAVARAIRRNSLESFTAMAKTLGGSWQTWVAWHHRVPAASIIVLQGTHHAQYILGAMDKSVAAPTSAVDLLHRLAIEEACSSGLRSYDMGSSGDDRDLSRFKKRFGAAETRFCLYLYERIALSNMVKVLNTLRHYLHTSPAIMKR